MAPTTSSTERNSADGIASKVADLGLNEMDVADGNFGAKYGAPKPKEARKNHGLGRYSDPKIVAGFPIYHKIDCYMTKYTGEEYLHVNPSMLSLPHLIAWRKADARRKAKQGEKLSKFSPTRLYRYRP
jgi:hypothetical protein